MGLRAQGLRAEVILPAFTWTATAHAVVWNGLTSVFADITPGSYVLNPEAISKSITFLTSAFMPANVFGCPPDYEAFDRLAMIKANQIRFLRRMIIPLLSKVNLGDITIHHHWTNDKFTLHSFKHREYWYKGKKRNYEIMVLFSKLIKEGDSVFEIGGHIGYVSLYFAKLVGKKGHVTVFEPGPNNLPYIQKNTAANSRISLVEEAVSDCTGTAKLYLDDLTGQNNSLIENFSTYEENMRLAFIAPFENKKDNFFDVPCTSLDDFLVKRQLKLPSFIKIDAEGAELSILRGMLETLKQKNIALMVAVHANAAEVFRILHEEGFNMFDIKKNLIENYNDMQGNIFCVKRDDNRISLFKKSNSKRSTLLPRD